MSTHSHDAQRRDSDSSSSSVSARTPGKRSLAEGLIQRKELGGAADAAAAPEVGTDSGFSAPDHVRGNVEKVTGADLGGVRLHTDAPAADAAQAVQAKAFTSGQDVYFNEGHYQPGTAGGDHLIAHELAHTVQQSRHGSAVQTRSMISAPGDAAELEADRVADAAVSGATTSISVGEAPSAIAREALNGNPADLSSKTSTDAAGKLQVNALGTTHAAPTAADAQGHQKPGAASLADEHRHAFVKVKHGRENPMRNVCPASQQALVEEAPAAAEGFQEALGFDGTLGAPIVEDTATNDIFINNAPTSNDVMQGQIGDCWLLATTISVVSSDPGKIRQMVQPDGNGGANVTLYHKVVDQPNAFMRFFGAKPTVTYQPVTIAASRDLSFDRSWQSAAGQAPPADRLKVPSGGFSLHGAQLIQSQAPRQDYWGELAGNRVEIHRRDTWQMARWAPLLEKAYARFTQTYGQYGDGTGKNGANAGYDNINGGWPHMLMPAFYGAEAAPGADGAAHQTSMAYTPGAGGNILMQNQAAVNDLLTLTAGGTPPDKVGVVTATAMSNPQYLRTQAVINAVMGSSDWANLQPMTQLRIINTNALITAWTVTPNDPAGGPVPGPKAQAEARIAPAAGLAVDTTQADLFDPTRSALTKEMIELLATIRNAGTDNSKGQRHIYGNHVYGVQGVEFVSTTGVPVPLATIPAANRPAFYPLVDVFVSKIHLRNPHHANEPDIMRTGPADGVNDGAFDLTLDQFFRAFTSVEAGVFKRTT